MSHIELESWIAKTLILLKSPSEESVEELRSMLVETIHQKYNGRKQYKMIPPVTGCENNERIKSKDAKSHSSSDHKHKHGGFSPSVTASPDSYASDSDSSSTNSEMVILEEDVTCSVCREGVYTQWNQIMDCAECHAVYHQQCHNPPVPDSDVSDPRVVWYCRNCTKTLSKPKTSSLAGSSSQNSKSSSKTSGRSNTSSPSFGSKPFGGVSVSSKKSSSSKSSHSSSSKSHTPNINIISADKRLQIMKKKAARKQEKRPK
ncbi:unnamed protein product [Nezara viridula]|uniref:Integrator complex subunit 12 n=1 Tax=Nezara viridula TaxID=85310 RepID=A0A9P0HSC0_NEZVI|nr:unnamed protein product [Nezara viridula]